MWASIVAAIEALPKMVGLIEELVKSFQSFLEMMRQERINQWIEEGRKVERELGNAKTDEQRRKVLQDLQRLRGNLPK